MAITTLERAHVNAYIDADMRRDLERLALENDRSLSAEMRIALRRHLERTHRHEEGSDATYEG